jgi:hypothetical protein
MSKRSSENPSTIAEFYAAHAKRKTDVTLLEYHDWDTPLCIIRFPSAASTSSFLTFAEKVVQDEILHEEIDPLVGSILFYKQAYTGNGPLASPILAGGSMDREYATCVFFRVIRGFSASACTRAIIVAVEFREGSEIRKLDFVFPNFGVVYNDVLQKINHPGPFRGIRSTEATLLWPGSRIANGDRLRVEVVPEEQRTLAQGERLLMVTRAQFSNGDYLQPDGWPAFLRITPGTSLGQMTPMILQALNLEQGEAKKVKFLRGEQWVLYSPTHILKPEADLSSFSDRTALFVLPADQRPKRAQRREQALTIKN